MKILKLIQKEYSKIVRRLSLEVIIFILLTIASLFCLVKCVPLTFTVDKNFFFSSDDPQFQSEHKMDRLFVRKDSQLIISATGNINDSEYREKISALSEVLLNIDGVVSVNSLTHAGPGTTRRAINSPLWKRLIMTKAVELLAQGTRDLL